MSTAAPMKLLAYFVGVLMSIGASFGAMNTMYAQVSARIREIATMRALGFSRRVVLLSFVSESVALSLVGGIAGAAIAWLAVRLLLTAPAGTSNFTTFSEILFNFDLSPPLLIVGVVFSVIMGFFGGIFPAARAARTPIITALREV
jgi:putative ABC transport system permease protein